MKAVEAAGLEEARRRLFQVAFDEFEKSGNWPAVNALARRLVHEMDVHGILEGLGYPWAKVEAGQDQVLVLRLPAILLCTNSGEVQEAFARTLQLAVKRYFGNEPVPELKQSDLVHELGLSNLRAHQALVLFREESLWSGIKGNAPGNWVIEIDNRVRPFREARTVQDYVTQRYAADLEAHPLDGRRSKRRTVMRPDSPPFVFVSHSGSKRIVEALVKVLRARLGDAVTVWTDADLSGGRWDENIREKLEQATAFVAAATPSILTSIYAGFETGYVDARLGRRNIFLLRLGVSVAELQNRPPLSHYQSYDGTDPQTLAEFCTKMAQEMGLKVREGEDFEAHAALLAREVGEEARSAARVSAPVMAKANRLVKELEQQLSLARRHAFILYGSHGEAEVEPFDFTSCKTLVDDLFESWDDSASDALSSALSRLRQANSLLEIALRNPGSNGRPSKAQLEVAHAARHLREPLVQALFHARRCFDISQPSGNPYPPF